MAPGRAALDRGIAWLLATASPDGAFRSRTYGLLAGGFSLTPLVLRALDRAEVPNAATARSVAWMLAARRGGALGLGREVVDYPVYATGMFLSVLGWRRPRGWHEAAAPSVAWLRTQQIGAAWAGHPSEGGFGVGQERLPEPPFVGHVDLSMTRRAIEGLRAVGVPPEDPALVAARAFVHRARAPGGGHVYSPGEPALDKAGPGRGYGTATCDGLLARLALGESDLDADLAFLHGLHRPDRAPGLEGGPFADYALAMRGYYRSAAAEVLALLGGPPGWREDLVAAIVAEQHDDGSWRNELPHQKEDDPIVATAFAVSALGAALGRPRAGHPGSSG